MILEPTPRQAARILHELSFHAKEQAAHLLTGADSVSVCTPSELGAHRIALAYQDTYRATVAYAPNVGLWLLFMRRRDGQLLARIPEALP